MTSTTAFFAAPTLHPSERMVRRAGALVMTGGLLSMALLSTFGVWLATAELGTMNLRVNVGLEAVPFLLGAAALDRRDMARRHLRKAIVIQYLGFITFAFTAYAIAQGFVLPGFEAVMVAQASVGLVGGLLAVVAHVLFRRADKGAVAWRTGWPRAGLYGLGLYGAIIVGTMLTFISKLP